MQHLTDLADALAPERGFMHLDDEYTDFERARVVVVPVPFDGTTCYQPGTREGPRAIIDASRRSACASICSTLSAEKCFAKARTTPMDVR